MRKFFRCVAIFIIKQLREPIEVFWSFVAPIAYILLNAKTAHGFHLPADILIQTAGWSFSYIVLLGACNGFGLYLAGRRESEFVRSFLSNPSRRRAFILAQYLASLTMTLAFSAALIAVTAYTLADIELAKVITLFMKFATFMQAGKADSMEQAFVKYVSN